MATFLICEWTSFEKPRFHYLRKRKPYKFRVKMYFSWPSSYSNVTMFASFAKMQSLKKFIATYLFFEYIDLELFFIFSWSVAQPTDQPIDRPTSRPTWKFLKGLEPRKPPTSFSNSNGTHDTPPCRHYASRAAACFQTKWKNRIYSS